MRIDNFEGRVSATQPFNLVEIIELISRDAQDPMSLQRNRYCIQKGVRENPSKLMPPFRPGIGKQKVISFY